MKKYYIFLSVVLIIYLGGCGNSEDYEGIILEVKETSIVVGEDDVKPNESYATYEFIINDETELSGSGVSSFSELNYHQLVKVWIENKEFDPTIKQIATKVEVVEQQ